MPRILYIEDNIANIELIRRYLNVIDCDFYEAIDGNSGIDSAITTSPDLILLDIYLPDINGLQVADHLRALPEFANIPIIAITTDDSNELQAECYERGFDAVLHKPVPPQHLLNVIAEMTA
jgi:CheY-like chemotaxis protein